MLETKADLTTGLGQRFNCIPLHGSLTNLEYHLCHEAYQWKDYHCIIEGCNVENELKLPCPQYNGRSEARKKAGMRPLPIRQLQPSMVMLNQTHPQSDKIAHLARNDGTASPDLLLILDTNLKIHRPKSLFTQFARQIRGQGGKIIYVNRSKPPNDCSALIDYWIQWDVDE